MTGPFLMVLTNLIISFFLLVGIIIYRYVYPKKHLNLLVLLILISILPLISIFRVGVYESGDLSTHIMEEIFFYKLLQHGNLFPIWAGEMNATYGYPAFHFTYPLPFYIMAVFHFLGVSFINSAKLLLASSFFLSGIFMYLWLKKEVRQIAAVGGALFYLFAPYHFINLHFRADVGEVLAFVFLPLSLWAASNFLQTKSIKWFCLEAFSLAALILSHPALSLVGFAVLCAYILIFIFMQNRQKIKFILLQIICVVISLLLTAFYWLPVMYDLQFTSTHKFVKIVSFVHFEDLLYSPWKYGFLFQGPQGQLSFLIGYAQLLVLIFAVIMLIKRKIFKKEKPLLLVSLIVVLITIFMMLPIASPLWTSVPFLKSFQFSYRLLGVNIFSLAVIAAIVLNNIKKKWLITLICLLAVFSTILNWGNRGMLPNVTDDYLSKQLPYTATNGAGLGQAAPIWTDYKNAFAKKIPSSHLEIMKGEGSITEQRRDNSHHVYSVNAKNQLVIKENTLYFPGWNVFIDKMPQKITILSSSTPKGVISFVVPKGKHEVEVIFQDTNIIKIGKVISLIGILLLLIVTTKAKMK
jgi:hypothetical protein